MTTFIILAVLAILLIAVMWIWLALQNKNFGKDKSFVGKSTILELISKERRKRSQQQNNEPNR
ncbi:MAG: hypothetical protein ONA90_01005 [candidate division KSB1 bacterium]|nr:hypothetical protein [candidate division KSB1 bacterium]